MERHRISQAMGMPVKTTAMVMVVSPRKTPPRRAAEEMVDPLTTTMMATMMANTMRMTTMKGKKARKKSN
eukprot:2791414-Karenia_brevis.AAC.1